MTAIDNCVNESWKSFDMEYLDKWDAEILHHSIYCENLLKINIPRDKNLVKVGQFLMA